MAVTLKQRVRKQLSSLDHVEEGDAIFDPSERGFFVDGRLVAEFAGPNTIGVRLTWPLIRDRKKTFVDDPRIDPIRSGTDWVTVQFRRANDLALVATLVELAAQQYLPPPGQPLRPPPTGADLDRRRRFH